MKPRKCRCSAFLGRSLVAAVGAGLLVTGLPRAAHPFVIDILPDATFDTFASAQPNSIQRHDDGEEARATVGPLGPNQTFPTSGSTQGFFLPEDTLLGFKALARGDTTNAGAESSATLNFFMEAIEISTPPESVQFVEILVEGVLAARAAANGDSSNGATISVGAGASISLGGSATVGAGCANSGSTCITSQQVQGQSSSSPPGILVADISLPYSFEFLVPIAQVVTGSLSASGTVSIVGEPADGASLTALYSATADPTIMIDPSFPFRNDFELIFSPNLSIGSAEPSPAPAPSTLLEIVMGMGVLVLGRRRRRGGATSSRP